MKLGSINFRDHFLAIALVPAIVVIGIISYNKFIVNHDYIVSYEGVCDPSVQQCFIGCEDEECTEAYYYSKVQKYAQDLYAQCGKDITDCKVANECLLGDRKCSVTFCSPEIDGESTCSSPSGETEAEESEEVSSENSELEENNDINNNI